MHRLVIVAILVAPAVAAADLGWHPASLDIGGQHILTFRAGAGGLSAPERRALLEFRLTQALTLTSYRQPVRISYDRVPGGIAIRANGYHFVTVTSADAKANRSPLEALARQWGAGIKAAFEVVGPARVAPPETPAPDRIDP